MKKSILFSLFTIAVIFLFSFVGWALRGHGTIGLLRVTPIFLYVLIFICASGITLIGLFLWYIFVGRATKDSEILNIFDGIYENARPRMSEQENIKRAPDLLRENARELGKTFGLGL